MFIDSNKTVYKNLIAIPGIGSKKAFEICETIGVSLDTNMTSLSLNKKEALTNIISNLKKTTPGIENELKLFINNNIQRLVKINSYRRKTA